MKKILGIFLLGLFLNGCGIGGAYLTPDKERYRNTAVSTLCINYYEDLVVGNIHATAKREMIEERGLDCTPYKEEGILAGDAKNAYYEKLKGNLEHLGSSSASTSVRNKPVNCTTRKVGGYVRTFCY